MKTIKSYYVYIITNRNNKTLYVGVTNNLARRIFEHKTKINKGFTSKYNINKLVYYETFSLVIDAIKREKQLKRLSRVNKEEIINHVNSDWKELKPPIHIWSNR
ncbi:GIY-YIG nuclease family protein [Brumimicrobium mesophilum]|uniref:GIY-YIG nuclease family protein n=1 Tax=Brumimicrobium mesophilum TaxID=392717 RepID=UPI000D141625|nr:GIY-YIG nuclease family protein [Brumimicrobium mesophilum]